MIYKGEFTYNDIGKEYPAVVLISSTRCENIMTDEQMGAVKNPIRLGEDPVVITWDETSLTDVIHPSQMQVSICVEFGGDYRELLSSAVDWHVALYFHTDEGYWESWWSGVNAERTWDEPYSRYRNYMINVTFSDFGYLSKVKYPVEEWDGFRYALSVLDSALEPLQCGYTSLVYSESLPEINDTTFYNASLRSNIIFEEDGITRKNCTRIIEDILSPLGAHIIQYGGYFRVYRPNLEATDTWDNSPTPEPMTIHGPLLPGGMDARLYPADYYSGVKVSYKQEDTLNLKISRELNVKTAGYLGAWLGGDNPDNPTGYFVMSEELYNPDKIEGYVANYIEGACVAPCIVLATSEFGHDTTGGRMPQMTPSATDPDITDITLKLEVGGGNSPRFKEYPVSSSGNIEIELPIFLRLNSVSSQAYYVPNMKFNAVFKSATTNQTKFLRKSTAGPYASLYWSDTLDGYQPLLRYEVDKNAADDRFMENGKWGKMKIEIPPTGDSGTILFTIILSSIWITTTIQEEPYKVGVYAVQLPTVRSLAEVSSGMINESSVVERKFAYRGDSDAFFEKEFKLGTPVLNTIATLSNFFGLEEETAQDGHRLIDRYADYVQSNFDLGACKNQRRWRLSGTYKYPHRSGRIPFFDEYQCKVLREINRGVYAMTIRREEWHLRKGYSYLDLEEFSINQQ